MSDILADLEPGELWRHFAALSAIPRPSGHEQAAAEYVKKVATDHGCGFREDAIGNLVVFVDGEDGPPAAVVQAHLDMVCEKDPEVEHDFLRDPIPVRRAGNRVYAGGTTLGADNGIGVAAALALITSDGVRHGPLELLFTVQEETGLHGASAFDASLLQSKLMINLDSEDPEELTVGCAGGATIHLTPNLRWEAPPEGWVGRELAITGLRGGHSGVDIHKPLGNAIRILTSALGGLRSALEVRLAGLAGGTAHNVIPRSARARLAVAPSAAGDLDGVVARISANLGEDWAGKEPGVALTATEIPVPESVLAPQSEDGLLGLLAELPHGVIEMSEDFPGKVDTSANLAQVRIDPDRSEVVASARSLSAHKLFRTRTAISTAGLKIGAGAKVQDSYPGWDVELDTPLLELARREYEQVYGKPASIQVVHGGLECGVLVSKKPDMHAISFGPLITGAHSPGEQVDAATVDTTWQLLVRLLGALAELPADG